MAVNEKSANLFDRIHELVDCAVDEETQARILMILSIAEEVILLGLKLLRRSL